MTILIGELHRDLFDARGRGESRELESAIVGAVTFLILLQIVSIDIYGLLR